MINHKINQNESLWDLNRLTPRKTKTIGNVNLDEFKISGYVQGSTIRKAHILWKHFDWVQLVNSSKCEVKRTEHFLFIRFRNEKTTVLICEKK